MSGALAMKGIPAIEGRDAERWRSSFSDEAAPPILVGWHWSGNRSSSAQLIPRRDHVDG
jgi:hypothetical protein